MDKRASILRGRVAREPNSEVDKGNAQKREIEEKFKSFTHGRGVVEYRSVRHLLKCKPRLTIKGCADITITPEKEKELITQFKVGDRDTVDFERFYELVQYISSGNETKAQESEDFEYGKTMLLIYSRCVYCSGRRA